MAAFAIVDEMSIPNKKKEYLISTKGLHLDDVGELELARGAKLVDRLPVHVHRAVAEVLVHYEQDELREGRRREKVVNEPRHPVLLDDLLKEIMCPVS